MSLSLGYFSVALLIEFSNRKAAVETLSLRRVPHVHNRIQQRGKKETQDGAAGNNGHL